MFFEYWTEMGLLFFEVANLTEGYSHKNSLFSSSFHLNFQFVFDRRFTNFDKTYQRHIKAISKF